MVENSNMQFHISPNSTKPLDLKAAMPYNCTMKIKTETMIKVFGSPSAIARFYGCARQSVQGWGEFIPPVRMYELRDRRPDIFDNIAHGKDSQDIVI